MEDAVLAETIRAAQRGDAAAFDRLVGAYAQRIVGFLYRLTGSRDVAEELAQEVFIRLVRTLGAYRHDGRFEPWIFRIAANLARDRVRRIQRAPKVRSLDAVGRSPAGSEAAPDPEALATTAAPADAGLIREEDSAALHKALARLPVAEREVILLRHFSQMSFREIAEATGTPLGTALARAYRGLARLRRLMAPREEADLGGTAQVRTASAKRVRQ